jgi:hypothetical protein
MGRLFSGLRPYSFAMLAVLAFVSAQRSKAADDFAAVAGVLASPSSLNADEALAAHSDTKVMVRMELAHMALMTLHPSEDYLREIRDSIAESLNDCHGSMNRIKELDRYMPDIGGLAERALPAAPGLYKAAKNLSSDDKKTESLTDSEKDAVGQFVAKGIGEGINWAVNAYQASAERDQYKKYYSTVRTKAVSAIAKACRHRYKDVPASANAITADLNGSWNNTFVGDLLCLRNDTNQTLTNCTLVVDLKGIHAETGASEADAHIHFIGSWPAGQWLYANYPARCASGIASDESADFVQGMKIALYSDQLRSDLDYTYTGEEFDRDVKREVDKYLGGSKFSGQWYNYDNHFLYNNGFQVQYNGTLNAFPVTYITVEAKQGSRTKSIRWHISDSKMSSGYLGNKWLSDERFNGWDPDEVDVTFEFPHTDYKYTVTWNLHSHSNP